MLNSNFKDLSENELSKQLIWYKSEIDILDADPAIKAIIVCIHHDLINQDAKPLYSYLIIEKSGKCLKLIVRGFKKDFRFFELNIGVV